MRSINRMILLTWVLVCLACPATTATADEAERGIAPARSQEINVPARWRLNAAGQLEFLHDPLGNGSHLVRKTHTVVLVDRQPKMCGAQDRRHSWFFTEALLIESRPLSPPAPATVSGDPP